MSIGKSNPSLVYVQKNKILFKGENSSKLLAIEDINNQQKWAQIKKQLNLKTLNILIGESSSYITAFETKITKDKLDRKDIITQAQKDIPIILTEQNFDWQKKGNFIQILAIPSSKLNLIAWMAKQLKLKINSFQNLPLILTTEIVPPNKKEPFFIIASFGTEQMVLAVLNGVIGFTYTLTQEISEQILDSLTAFAQKKLNWKIHTLISINNSLDKTIRLSSKWKTIDKQINIMAKATTKKKTSSKKDEDVLELKPLQNPTNPTETPTTIPTTTETTPTATDSTPTQLTNSPPPASTPSSTATSPAITPDTNTTVPDTANQVQEGTFSPTTTPTITNDNLTGVSETDTTEEINTKPKNTKNILIVTGLVLTLGGLIAGGVFYSKTSLDNRAKASQQTIEKDIPTLSPPTSSPTPETLDLTTFNIQVLNGSGVAGRAGTVSSLLTNAGFSDPDTANADSYDYTKTEIKLKADTPEQVFDEIKKALFDNYTVEKKTLSKNSNYDVIVIVGEKK